MPSRCTHYILTVPRYFLGTYTYTSICSFQDAEGYFLGSYTHTSHSIGRHFGAHSISVLLSRHLLQFPDQTSRARKSESRRGSVIQTAGPLAPAHVCLNTTILAPGSESRTILVAVVGACNVRCGSDA